MSHTKYANDGSMDNSATNISNEDEKQKLMNEITELNYTLAQLKGKVGAYSFLDLELKQRSSSSSNDHSFEVPDVEADLAQELYSLAGLYCSKFDNDYVFEFKPGNDIDDDRVYCVQILNRGGRGKLGKFVMPIGLDPAEIEKTHTIKDFRMVKPFLRSCKHHVECYARREEQFLELQKILLDVKNCSCDATIDYTLISIRMSGIRTLDTGQIYDVTICLRYKLCEVWPYKLSMALDVDELPDGFDKLFNAYFKPLKRMDLKDAFEEIAGNRSSNFTWTMTNKSAGITEIMLGSDSDCSVDALKLPKMGQKDKTAKDQTQNYRMEETEKADADENNLIENTKRRKNKDVKRVKKKLNDGKKQAKLDFHVKGKKREEKLMEKIDEVLENAENEGNNVENGEEKIKDEMNLRSKKVNVRAETDEQVPLVEVEKSKAEQPNIATLTKTTVAKKTKMKRIERLQKELNEIEERRSENGENGENHDKVNEIHENKKDKSSRSNDKIPPKRANRKKKFNVEAENENESEHLSTQTPSNKQNDSSKKSETDTEDEISPKGKRAKVLIRPAANPESTRKKRKTKSRLRAKNRSDRELCDHDENTEKSENSARISHSDDSIDEPTATNFNKFNRTIRSIRSERKNYKIIVTPKTKGVRMNGVKSNVKKPEISKKQIQRNKETMEEKLGNLQKSRIASLNSHLLKTREQTASPRKRTDRSKRIRWMDQIRKQDSVDEGVINSTPICAEIIDQLNFSEIAELSNIDSTEKDWRGRKFLEGHVAKKFSSKNGNEKKREFLESNAMKRKTSRKRGESTFSGGSVESDAEKENDDLFNKSETEREKSAERGEAKKRRKVVKSVPDVNRNYSIVVDTNSSDDDLPDKDLLNDRELLKDLAYIKERSDFIPATKRPRKKKNNKKIKK